MEPLTRPLDDTAAEAVLAVINEAAQAYRGVIPGDCWHEPYMSPAELAAEMAAGVRFWGAFDGEELIGVMGRQDLPEVTLIRHAYVRTSWQRRGVGAALLRRLLADLSGPVLVGTWAAASWALRFYEQHGFTLLPLDEKDRLLSTFWSITPRQRETSVVLGLGW
ncbi:MAG: GNAT family N-acetyltransferase [Deltaproteobacteria bacterium]|nr:GNAT family N-acetyltransferase [Deltaproteobacteria bacterium]